MGIGGGLRPGGPDRTPLLAGPLTLGCSLRLGRPLHDVPHLRHVGHEVSQLYQRQCVRQTVALPVLFQHLHLLSATPHSIHINTGRTPRIHQLIGGLKLVQISPNIYLQSTFDSLTFCALGGYWIVKISSYRECIRRWSLFPSK